jgi:23S rRNA (cytidine1920-2'-O)/16S rRNA (cytidine1409-2'-O)-methyltransferase
VSETGAENPVQVEDVVVEVMSKIRIDKLIVERGLAGSRERAQALLLAGRILVNEQKIEKPGANVDSESEVRVLGDDLRYVSRGGLKLERALKHWAIDLNGVTCLDVGTSTGGFTDCMLQLGAARVIAVDTGYGQISSKLRDHPRLTLVENTNARHLAADIFRSECIEFVAMDVSFISATLVLPAVVRAAFHSHPGGMVVLVKPQFEVGRELVGKGGIVREEASHQLAVSRVRACLEGLGAREVETIESPVLGAEGNKEFLMKARFTEKGPAQKT